MKKLNITKEQFNRSRYFQRKYGKLEYVSESGKLFKTNKGNVLKFNENIHRPDVEDLDVPVTEEEEVLAQYIEQCIQEELGIGSSCETHNPGEEMHIEIFIGEDEYDEDTDLNELCADLEKLVNQIGKQEKYDSGTEWGDASFSPQGDYIYGEVWPLEGEYAINPKGELAKESTKKFGKKFNEGRLARKLNSGELFEKQMPALGKAIQKFIDSDGRKGQAGTWNIVSDDDGSIKLYEHHGYWVGTIVDGHMKWEDEDGFYVSAKYSEMILNALCDGGLIEKDECQRAIEDAYAREGDYEKEYGESRRFNESADQTPEDIIDNIVTLSILSRDAESAEEMFRDLKQELFSMGLFSGQIHDDFDDFHDIAIDFAEHHNFNKQFVEQAAVTLKSEIEQGLSRGEFGESTRRARRSARRFR